MRFNAIFLSTLSLRRATFLPNKSSTSGTISIHALLAESDPCGEADPEADQISIHALLAESDRHWQTGHSLTRQFLSTLSLRRATPCRWRGGHQRLVFLSTLSLRRATEGRGNVARRQQISIHALLAESDTVPDLGKRYIRISIHALLAESD